MKRMEARPEYKIFKNYLSNNKNNIFLILKCLNSTQNKTYLQDYYTQSNKLLIQFKFKP